MADFSFVLTQPAAPGCTPYILSGNELVGTGVCSDNGYVVDVSFDPNASPEIRDRFLNRRIRGNYQANWEITDSLGIKTAVDHAIDIWVEKP